MYALLAICLSLSPTKVDESIASAMRDKYGEQYGKMVRGGEPSLAAYEELFTYASPKYLSLSSPPYDQPDLLPKYTPASSPSENPSAHHLSLFLADIKSQLAAPTLRSFLRLYTTLGADKLAGLMGQDEEEVVESLMVLKGAMKSVRRTEGEGGLLEGREVLLGDLDFALDNVRVLPHFCDVVIEPVADAEELFAQNIVEIAETKPGRRFSEYFIRHGEKLRTLYDQVRRQPLVGSVSGASTSSSNGALAAGPTPGGAAPEGKETGAAAVAARPKTVGFAAAPASSSSSASPATGGKVWGGAGRGASSALAAR